MSLDLRSLIGKLDDTSRRALEGAAGLAVSRTHYDVEMEHWLAKLAELGDSDIPAILRHFELDPDRFLQRMNQALDEYKTGNSRRPDLSEHIELLAREGWVWASVQFGLAKVRSGCLLMAALADPRLKRRLVDIHPGMKNVNTEELEKSFRDIVAGSREDGEVHTAAAAAARELDASGRPIGSKTPSLDQYCTDLTADAAAGRVDPVLGRDPEIRQIIDILMRRRQNNPILTGEAGVGKTAVVEGFALRIANGDVPEPLKNIALKTLDLGLLQAGAGVKGEFENRLKQVIEEVKNSAQPIILFIDEAHTLIGAGGQEGQNDAANLLKPALARGELRTIAATTWAEYKKYFEKDPALTRRFQPVKVDEPSEDLAVRMMRGLTEKLEEHHGVRILDDAVVDSVRLSHRYIAARQLPDKSVSVLDTSCARVAIGAAATPPAIEDLRRQIDALEVERGIRSREQAAGADHAERLEEISAELGTARERLEALEARRQRELALVDEIKQIRAQLEASLEPAETHEDSEADETSAAPGEAGAASDEAPAAADETAAALDAAQAGELRAAFERKKAELAELQGEEPLVMLDVDGQTIAEVISGWTGIPVGKMVADEIHQVLHLVDTLGQRILGQDHALETIAKRIHTARANLDNPKKPIGVFLLVGPSGVGKTESALALADSLYGGERNVISINMSEYQEAHTVSSLKGSPPGYVGYGEGGVLTEAVRRRPYSVVLLDEVEKAHPDVMELFFQVFDKGVLEDGEGREIDFKNTIIMLTSNVGTDQIMSLCADPETAPGPEGLSEAVRPPLLETFPAALLGRLVVVPFYPLFGDVMRNIIRLQLDRVAKRVRENHGAELVYGEDLIEAVHQRCTEVESGGRAIDNILTNSMLPQISAEVLARMARAEAFSKVEVATDAEGGFQVHVT
jgi:type VI secretion system protein VasG